MNLLTVESDQIAPVSNKEKTFSELILEHPISNLISPPATWKIRPWDIDLLNMLQEFQDRLIISNPDQINLSLAGRAISVAAHIHRKRAEQILQEEKKRILKKKRKNERKLKKEVIQELELPSAPRLVSRRINTIELMTALARAVQIVKRKATRSTNNRLRNSLAYDENVLAILPKELIKELELGSDGIENFISKVYTTILNLVENSNKGSVGLLPLIQQILADEAENQYKVRQNVNNRLTRLYIVRIVLCLLYLILRSKITVNQPEFFKDLRIEPLTALQEEVP